MSERKNNRLVLPGLIVVTLAAACAVYFLRPSESVASQALEQAKSANKLQSLAELDDKAPTNRKLDVQTWTTAEGAKMLFVEAHELPMPVGMILLTIGIYHWHREQLAISAQMEKRERLFREHRLFDKLTPLAGADYLKRQLVDSLHDSREQQQPLSLLALDLDNFAAINQAYGHAEGDAVLQALSHLLLLNLRRQDLLCRLAGDRFVVLLPNTGERQAQVLALELQQAVRGLAHKTRQQGERLQLAATTAVVMALDEPPHDLLKRLNLALARAKQPLAKSA